MNENAEIRYLRMENDLLKNRLVQLTKNPDYIKPPGPHWIGNDPVVWDTKQTEIVLREAAFVSVAYQDDGHHIITRSKEPNGQELRYNYLLSDKVIYCALDRYSILEDLHSRTMMAIAYHMINKEYGWRE